GPRVGSFDGGYGAGLLARIVGQKKAREIWFLCEQYDAQEALAMGLVNRVVPLARLEEETVAVARKMLQLSPLALRMIKASLPAAVWWLAARPATLAASVSPVLAGTAVAVHDHQVRALPGLGALVVAIAMQIGVNYANDYADFVRGADTPRRVGPLRAAASGVVKPEHVRL